MHDSKRQEETDAVDVSEEAPNYRIRPLSLCFEDIRVEQRFNPTHLVRALPTIRLFFLVGALLYAVFGILDVYAVPASVTEVWVIRFGVIIPFLCLELWPEGTKTRLRALNALRGRASILAVRSM